MRIAFLNAPWYDEKAPELWGVRAGSRWPHFQRRRGPGLLPRYVPFPFFLAIAAAVARAEGHEVLLLDGVAEDLTLEDFYARVKSFHPSLVFMEVSTPSLTYDLAVARELANNHPNPSVVFGGAHALGLARELTKTSSVPAAWIGGEYDFSVGAAAEAIVGRGSLKKVPGLVFPGAGIENPPARIANVNALPAPLFDHLPMRSYSDPVCGLPSPSAQSWTSRGCPFGCSFCVWPQVIYGNRRFRPRHLDTALAEIEHLVSRYGCESFYFDDDTTNIGEKRMLSLAAKIKARGLSRLPWSMMARADLMTERVLDALTGAGMYSVKYGVESVSPKLLNACDKGLDLEKALRAIELTKARGLKIHLTFTFGLPGETPETLRETIDFAIATAPDTAQFSICAPFPGTKFYEDCRGNGWLTTQDWDRYLGSDDAVIETPTLKAAELKSGLGEALDRWAAFNRRRHQERQERLLARLRERVRAGYRWTFEGDRDFATFLWEKGGDDVKTAFIEKPNDRDVDLVIVSRHDEEKIARRFCRQGHDPERVSRLYG